MSLKVLSIASQSSLLNSNSSTLKSFTDCHLLIVCHYFDFLIFLDTDFKASSATDSPSTNLFTWSASHSVSNSCLSELRISASKAICSLLSYLSPLSTLRIIEVSTSSIDANCLNSIFCWVRNTLIVEPNWLVIIIKLSWQILANVFFNIYFKIV